MCLMIIAFYSFNNLKCICNRGIRKTDNRRINSLYMYISLYIFIYMAFTVSTPMRKDTGVFESFGRFIILLLD